MRTPSNERPFIIRPVRHRHVLHDVQSGYGRNHDGTGLRGIEEETVTRLPSKAFDEFLKALDRPVPQTARDLIGMEPDWL